MATRSRSREDQHEREQELIGRHVAESDAVITTALIPGRPAPVLITANAARGMRPGSVIVDLAAEAGGNCELTRPGETVTEDGVTIVGELNLPSAMPLHASQMYSRNVWTFLNHLLGGGSELTLDFEDEITRETCVTHEGRGRWDAARSSDGAEPGYARKSRGGGRGAHDHALLNSITVFVLAVFIGIEIISKVPTMLHTPLMSGTNAIHGIVLVGAMLIAGSADSDLEKALAFVAVVFATINVVGGFLVTDRMLEMFKRKPSKPESE